MRRPSGLDRFLRDRTSGAAELALGALEILERASRGGASAAELARLRRRLLAAHPAMGVVWNAVHAPDPATFRRRLKRAQAATVWRARRLVPRRARVVTFSYSSTVLRVLARRDLIVTVGESLPGGEGRKTARLLRRLGVSARVVPDAALALAVAEARLVVVGADAVTPHAIVNKLGTRLLALAARELRKPFYVVADRTKLVPASWPLPGQRAASSHGTPLFETVSRRLVTRIISDRS